MKVVNLSGRGRDSLLIGKEEDRILTEQEIEEIKKELALEDWKALDEGCSIEFTD